MNKIIIEKYPNKFFPWAVKAKGFCNVFESFEMAKSYAIGRFGKIDEIKK